MTKADLPTLRILATNNQISYSGHAFDQMLDRGISQSDVKNILSSPTNQLIEIQPPSRTPGKEHSDERALVSDPEYRDSIIVILVILFKPIPEIRIITAEYAEDEKWDTHIGDDPWVVRKT